MSSKRLLQSLFHYKASVDDELFVALAGLADAPVADRLVPALRVLHHAHIVDRIFAANLEGRAHAYPASWSDTTPALADLAAGVRRTDQWYLDYLSRLDAEALDQMVDFTFTDGGAGRMSRAEMLAHVVTHGGYHRGEAGRLLPEIETTAMRDVFAGFLHRSEPQRRWTRGFVNAPE